MSLNISEWIAANPNLNARAKTTIHIDAWELMEHIQTSYGITQRIEILESPNDTTLDVDVSEITISDREEAEEEREYIMLRMQSGDVQDYRLNDVLTLAVLDGHIPAAHYMVRVSW